MIIGRFRKKRFGLALGSGAARGWAHIGVIRAVEDAGITPASVAGCSMGAFVGAAYVAGKLDELETFARTLTTRTLLGYLDVGMPLRGLLTGDKISALLTEHLGDMAVEDTQIPFCAVATDLGTGKEVRLCDGNLVDSVMASIAIPGIFNPAELHGMYLVDGGLVNPVPVNIARELGADKVIGVDVNHDIIDCKWCVPEPEGDSNTDKTPQPDVEEVSMATPAFERYRAVGLMMRDRALNAMIRASRPNIFDVLGNTIDIMEHHITRENLTKNPPDLLVQPSLGHMSLWDFTDANAAIDEGYRAAKEVLKKL